MFYIGHRKEIQFMINFRHLYVFFRSFLSPLLLGSLTSSFILYSLDFSWHLNNFIWLINYINLPFHTDSLEMLYGGSYQGNVEINMVLEETLVVGV